ncbi:MAG: 4-oxalomesaconate tautomerase [Pseudomonadota bacterium]
MHQRAIPFHFMRGGTSRGAYLHRDHLPADRDALSRVLIAMMGAGNPRNIDGLGGGSAVTTKVALLSSSAHARADVDFLFAQVAVEEPLVDYGPTCGNILVGVGPAAIEMGLVAAHDGCTTVRIHAVNTGALVEAVVQTPDGAVDYDGDFAIDGVPGTAAPVALSFLEVVGSRTGAMLPTGHATETIEGIAVSCVDVTMPMVIASAQDFGISGAESQDALDGMDALFARIEPMRIEAGRRMGLGDVTHSVIPKVGLVAAPSAGGHFMARYFMPWRCHPTVAVSGSQCLAAAALITGTVLDGLTRPIGTAPAVVTIEHPRGTLDVTVDYAITRGGLEFRSAGVVQTARLIAHGEVMVPARAFTGD